MPPHMACRRDGALLKLVPKNEQLAPEQLQAALEAALHEQEGMAEAVDSAGV